MIEPRPLTRADIAIAMVEVIANDHQLVGAMAVNEAWTSGYVARLLTHAEVIAAQSANPDDPLAPEPLTAEEAVRKALDATNPWQVLLHYSAPVSDGAREALVVLLRDQAEFHSVAAALERRGLRRHPLPE